ncbi:MAG TPA: D-glycero-beta-D-manno-heptose-7-phosphate kinase [Chitinispirillaceae bacterium]|nr:D-glycero-beta-D-manno-heptose-7-phosphate kinase [Chitinispirillaceae bacterium]
MNLDFKNARVLVVGDLMLDRYYFGNVTRISPEAPVPVARITSTRDTLGGAGNVANNLVHLGASCILIGATGEDEHGDLIHSKCESLGIDFRSIRSVSSTIVKIRVFGEHQQIVRVDFEDPLFIDSTSKNMLFKTFDTVLDEVSVVVISDYGKGFCTPGLCSHIIENARKRGLKILIDPKGKDWNKYRNSSIITPNVKELSDIAGSDVDNNDSAICQAASKIRSAYSLEHLLVTRSEKGMSLLDQASCSHFPTEAKEVFDVSGAGDTVMATLAASLAAGYDMNTSTRLANKAAGIVCGKVGTAPIELAELQTAILSNENSKITSETIILQKVQSLKNDGKKIVFTNGCFDLIHRGQLHLLSEAKKLGDILIVAINSDESIREIKGNRYPVNDEQDRAYVVSSIKDVDFVTIFNEKTPETLLAQLKPDVIVKGGNYTVDEIVGKEFAGSAFIIPILEGYSSQDLNQRFQSAGIE